MLVMLNPATYSEETSNKFSANHNNHTNNTTANMGNQKFQTPKILTHVIDEFVVEESESPFVEEIPSFQFQSYQLEMIRKRQMAILEKEKEKEEELMGVVDQDGLLLTDMYRHDSDVEMENNSEDRLLLTAICEACGFSGPRRDFVKPLFKFCSAMCARKFRSGRRSRENGVKKPSLTNGNSTRRGSGSSRKRGSRHHSSSKSSRGGSRSKEPTPVSPYPSDEDEGSEDFCDMCNNSSSELSDCSNDSPLPSPICPVLPFHDENSIAKPPTEWTVDDVGRYIASIPDAASFADEFRNQEIDGSALMLIQEEHLVYSMNFTLGRALKLCAHIDKLRNMEA